MIDIQNCVREEIIERHLEQKCERAAIDACPIGVRHRYRADPGFDVDGKRQFAQITVDNCRHHLCFMLQRL